MAADVMGLLRPGSASTQKQAVETLIRLSAADSVSALVPLLESPDPGVRQSVLDALGSLGAKETAPHPCYSGASPREDRARQQDARAPAPPMTADAPRYPRGRGGGG